ncbi:DNA-methyltransferase [Candidatus Magnetominusculus xianensis]|nr:site-specific DNA-methyltransferase [Nitrospirota bacterium]
MDQLGITYEINAKEPGFRLHYSNPNGSLYQGDSILWLDSIEDESIDLIFADPPYNINKAEWDNFESQEHYIEWSLKWIIPASRILKPHGSLYICGFSEILADIKHTASKYFKACRWLIWHYKNKANLGNDWGRSHESVIQFRKSSKVQINVDTIRIQYGAHTLKYPSHPQAATSQYGNGIHRGHWTPHPLGAKPKDVLDIPTTCNGMGEKTPHPTQKPEELVRKFVLASSNKGDIVLDPFSGSGTTLVAAQQLGRKWLGCELNPQYNDWAIQRLENIREMTVDQWIEHDRKVQERRESIR